MANQAKRSWTDRILAVIEPLVYGQRLLMLAILIGLTLFFGWQASQTRVDAGFDKSIPLEHPYMVTLKKYQQDFGGGNTVLVSLIQDDGDIYNEKFLAALKAATDEVFFLPGVDRSRVSSLFTPDVRFTEVVEGGFAGGNVIPAEYQPTQEMFDLVRSNVGKAGIIGRYVTTEQNGAMIFAELLETDPVTGEKLDYRVVAKNLEAIRGMFEKDGIKVHIVGFAKVIGDVTDAAAEVVFFFVLALLMTAALLWLYTASFKLSMVVLVCSLVAVIWEFGLLTVAGFGLDPFAILIPFLVLSVSTSHGVQYVNAWVGEVDKGAEPFDASLETFRRLAIPGTTALITDVAGFATIYLIPIDIIREMSINAAFGMLAIIITNKVLAPIWLTYVNIPNMEEFRKKQLKREEMGDGLWRFLAKVTRPVPALMVIMVSAATLGFSLYKYQDLQVGDSQEGVPELRPDSRYNQDSRAIVNNFAIGVDILKVIAEAPPESCIRYPIMEEIDRFAWHMDNTQGVSSTISLPQVAKMVNGQFNEGTPNMAVLPRNKYVMVQAITPIPTSSGLLNPDCSAMAVLIFTEDHRAETIKRIVAEVKEFNDSAEHVNFALATGNVGVMAATNEVVKEQELQVVGWVYVVILVFMWLSFRSVCGVLCVVLPLSLVSAMAYAVMAMLGIGLKVATLPVVALAVGIGVDYGIYIYSTLLDGLSKGKTLEESFYDTLHRTGKAVIFTGIALGGSVSTWLLSDLQFQADMGILLVFMFTANMFGAILGIPALARFLVKHKHFRDQGEQAMAV
ncbi:MAG: efflux RND transporter permease subunit [Oceanococcaceae bacterium]